MEWERGDEKRERSKGSPTSVEEVIGDRREVMKIKGEKRSGTREEAGKEMLAADATD